MQEDAQLAVGVPFVAERVLHFGLAAICSVGEVVGAHGNGSLSTDINLVVLEDHVRPSLAAVDGKASILSIAVLDGFVPNKVGHGIFGCRSKLRFGCLGWLEENIGMAIAIQRPSCFRRSGNIVSSIQVGLGDTLDGPGPCCLHTFHLCFGDRCSWRGWGHAEWH